MTAPPPDALALRLDELVGSVQARDRAPSLSAAVFRDGEVLWQRAIGLADAERGEEATGEHAYRIGSITKTFTAVALLGQVEDGRLELDAPLAAYLDEAPRGPTLRMALAHLSGLQRETAVVLVNAGAQVDTAALALDLTEAALDALPRPTERWLPDAGAPAEVSGLLGRWWTEGDEVIFTWRGGKLHAELVGGPPGRSDSVFEPSGDDRFTVSAGREHGEILEVFREQGTIRRLTLAGYPLTREPSTYG